MSAEPNIKYRVTGALVLIALAVIFLPLILDGQKKNQILESRIPEKPVTGEIVLVNSEETAIELPAKDKTPDSKVVNKEEPDAKKVEVASQDQDVIVKKVPKKIFPTANNTKKDKKLAPVIKSIAEKNPPVKKDIREDRPNFKSSAFVIQLGSFGNKANAQKLVDKLKAAGYKAYLREGASADKKINRVLVGPELKRTQAESKIAALNKISGLKAIIIGYDPLRH